MTHGAIPYDEQDLLGYADPAQYIGVDDRLLICAVSNGNGLVLTITGRVLLVEGVIKPFQFTYTIPRHNLLATFTQQLAQGFLLGLEVSASDGAQDGFWTYAKVDLTRGGGNPPLPFQTLFAGYVDKNFAFGYPKQRYQRPTDGPGTLLSYPVDTPAAGADWTYTVPDLTRQRIIGVMGALTTSAAAADRLVQIRVAQGGGAVWSAFASGTQAASLGTIYSIGPAGVLGGSAATGFLIPLPQGLTLAAGGTISSSTANIDAADQWSFLTLLALEWALME